MMNRPTPARRLPRALVLALPALLTACCAPGPTNDGQAGDGWTPLFDGKTLKNWKTTDFGGHGEPYVENGELILPTGEVLTGVTWTGGELPKMNYEIYGEAKRVNGTDFFYGLTFPVNDKHASLVIGGWGGTLCGISSLDGMDASENETTFFPELANGKWYAFRLRVLPNKLQAWMGKEKVVDVDTTGRNIDVRIEVEASKPLGLSSFQSTAAIRNLKYRKIDPPAEESKGGGS